MSPLRNRVHKRVTALVAVCALLFAQFALASYLCPGQQQSTQPAAMMMDDGVPCEGMDLSQPALCHAHCAGESALLVSLQLPALAVPVPVGLVSPAFAYAAELQGMPAWANTPVGQPPPEPLFLATRRLRV